MTELTSSLPIWKRFHERSQEFSARIAVSSSGGEITFSELYDGADRYSEDLRQCGIKADDLVCLTMINCAELVAAYLALCKLSCTIALVSVKYQKKELESIIANLRPSYFITNESVGDALSQKISAIETRRVSFGQDKGPLRVLIPDAGIEAETEVVSVKRSTISLAHSPALVKFTSGSTGQPKAVALSAKNVLAETQNVVETLGVTADDRILAAIPLSHSYGFDLGILAMLYSGAQLIIHENFIPRRVLHDLEERRITIFLGVPSMYRFFLETHLDTAPDLSHVRYFLSCTAPLNPEDIEAFHARFGALICQHYGSSETGAAANHIPEEILARPHSVGKAMKNVKLEIVDPKGQRLPPGSEGDVLISGECVALGYLMGERPGEDAIKNNSYRTGDVGYLDEDGFLYLKGRKDQIINVGGHKVSPDEVVRVLENHPAVREAAVVGAKDQIGEEIVYAAATLKSPATENDLLGYCHTQLAEYKVPRRIDIFEEMPQEPSGKIRLRPGDGSVNRTEIEKDVTAILRDDSLVGNRREIDLTSPLGAKGLGLDSMSLVQFIIALENGFGIEIPETIWIERGQLTLQDIVGIIYDTKESGRPTYRRRHLRPIEDYGKSERDMPGPEIQERGFAGDLMRVVLKSMRRIIHLFYQRDTYYVLSFDLARRSIPTFDTSERIVFSTAKLEDASAVEGVWYPRQRKRKLKRFRKRLSKGYECFIAKLNNTVVALDWVTGSGDYEPFTGLHIKLSNGCCYGMDLNEHPDYKDRGIGLATLIYCMRQTKTQGYTMHYTIVHAHNERMLMTATQLIGFNKAGRINVRRFLGRPYSSWKVGNRTGNTRILTL